MHPQPSIAGDRVMVTIYHGTPMTPRAALLDVLVGRAACVSFYRPDDVGAVESISPAIMFDNGAYSFWKQALKAGNEWCDKPRDWKPYYDWLDERLWHPGRWAVIPDMPGAPSQLNDALLNEWPHGTAKGAPLWHMDQPVERLARLCEKYDRVCLGWTLPGDPVGSDAYHRRMDDVAGLFGNHWPVIHMMRGVAVARDYPFRQCGLNLTRSKWMAARQPHGRASLRSVARETGIC